MDVSDPNFNPPNTRGTQKFVVIDSRADRRTVFDNVKFHVFYLVIINSALNTLAISFARFLAARSGNSPTYSAPL